MIFTSVAAAAEFSPALDEILASRGAEEWVSAILILESPLDIRALDERLHDARAPLAERHRVIIGALQFNARETQPKFVAELEAAKNAGSVQGYTAYWIENLVVVRARVGFFTALRARGDIRYATENFRTEIIDDPESRGRHGGSLDSSFTQVGLDAIGATRVNTELGITGNGVLVATVDGGVDVTHPALAEKWRGNYAPHGQCWFDALGFSTEPYDDAGHGSHVMGTLCGQEITAVDTITVGCAPNALWISSNAVNQGPGEALDNDVIAAFQWLIDPDSNANTLDDVPDVIQNSWGVNGTLGYPDCFDYWNTVILNCEAAGPVITWSAGNEGNGGLRSPANYEITSTQIFAVGAVDATNFPAPYPLAGFSSRGPSSCQPNPTAIKPEIVAPGVSVVSCDAHGGYASRNGTSMAGPHVAGTVALMREACPDCDPTTLKQILMDTAIDEGYGPPGPDNQFGSGFVDAYSAVVAALGFGRVHGIVRDVEGNPLPGASIRNVSGVQFSSSDENGEYSIALPAGVFSLQYSRFGYDTLDIGNIAVETGEITEQDVVLQAVPVFAVSGTVFCYSFPAPDAVVRVLNVPISPDTTDALGNYQLSLPAGVYSMLAWANGCDSLLLEDVVVTGNTTVDFPLNFNPVYLCGPADPAGFSACENGDYGGPVYSWLEISPMAGGPGTPTGMNGDDQAVGVELPFTFRFYGIDYDSVFISTNGVINFDSTSILHNNRPLPIPDLGHAIVVYWDDFYPLSGGGDVSYYYYAEANAFIVEWYNLEHFPGGPPRETFQVWIYNVLTNPGPSGDSQIRMQYASVDPVSTTTIGLQDGMSQANQYVHLGELQLNAQGITSGRVITYGGYESIGGTIQGVITDCFGASADSASVYFPGSSFGPVTTNSFGFYSIGVASGSYTVHAQKSPCSSAEVGNVLIASAQTVVVDLTLNPRPVIQGHVTNCFGGPAIYANIEFPNSDYPLELTDSTGFYSMPVHVDTFFVRADNEICSLVESDSFLVGDGQTVTIDLILAPPPEIRGMITNCTGVPAAGAVVTLPGFGYSPVITDSVGGYAFQVANGTYRVRADNDSCSFVLSEEMAIQDGQTLVIDLTLRAPPAIAGLITDCFGAPAIHASVEFPGSVYAGQYTDLNGRYFQPLHEGIYSILADNQSCSFVGQDSIFATEGDTVVVNLTLRSPPAISGVVTDCRGGVAESCTINLVGSFTDAVEVDPSGHFFIPVIADTFVLIADNAWCSRTESTDVVTVEAETTFVSLTLREPAAISGRIIDCFGNPAIGTLVQFLGDSSTSTLTDDSGDFLAHVYPDTYIVWSDNELCSTVMSPPADVQDGDTITVNLTLAAPPRIQGYVTHCDGNPAANLPVSFPGTQLNEVETDGTGFYFVNVMPDSYVVRAVGPTCSSVESERFYVGDGDFVTANLTLGLPGVIQGTVFSCNGGNAAGAEVLLLASTQLSRMTDAAGFYSFDSLPSGVYSVAVRFPGCVGDSAFDVFVAPGLTAQQDFFLDTDPAYLCGGMDGYSYSVCEDIDAGGKSFAWREIAPAAGGTGIPLIGLGDDGFAGPLILPFPMNFFGTQYNEIYVSANGVVSFGAGIGVALDNCLPQVSLPAAIFLCWDDLDPTDMGAEVVTRFDPTAHVFIIEYYDIPRCCDGTSRRTFELVLFDQSFYPTTTGDNEFVLQYSSTPSPESITTGFQSVAGEYYYTHLCTGINTLNSGGVPSGRAIFMTTGSLPSTVDLVVSPSSVTKAVPVGGLSTDSLLLCNAGTAIPLIWNLDFYQDVLTPALTVQLSGHDETNTRERDVLDSRGGPDGGGYFWQDSNEPDGPVYHWVEIREAGINTNLHANNQYATVPLPWPFTHYGTTYNSIYISTNGNAQFSFPSIESLNRPLPATNNPNGLLAVLYDDLSTAAFGNIYYLNDSLNNRFIIEWDSVGRGSGLGAYTFECVLYRNGSIIYQYKLLSGIVNSASVGMEDRYGTVGTQVVYNANYLTTNLAIRFATFPQWMTLTGNVSGMLNPGECVAVPMAFRSGSIAAGTYTGEITIQSNDLDENPTTIPVQFLIGALEPPTALTIHASMSANQIQLRWQPTGAPFYKILSATAPGGPFETLEATTGSTTVDLPAPVSQRKFFTVVGSTTP